MQARSGRWITAIKRACCALLAVAMLATMTGTLAADKTARRLDSFEMAPKSISLTPGQRVLIRATKSSDETAALSDIAVSVSPKGIVSVDEFWCVKALKKGNATITMKAKNGKGSFSIPVKVAALPKPTTLDTAADKKSLAAIKTKPKAPKTDAVIREITDKTRKQSRVKPFLDDKKMKDYQFTAKEADIALGMYAAVMLYQAKFEKTNFFDYQFLAVDDNLFPDLPKQHRGALRAWLRSQLKGVEVGDIKDFVPGGRAGLPEGFEESIMNPRGLDSLGGASIGVEGVLRIDKDHYIVNVFSYYADLKARGYEMAVTRQKDGRWEIISLVETWVS